MRKRRLSCKQICGELERKIGRCLSIFLDSNDTNNLMFLKIKMYDVGREKNRGREKRNYRTIQQEGEE